MIRPLPLAMALPPRAVRVGGPEEDAIRAIRESASSDAEADAAIARLRKAAAPAAQGPSGGFTAAPSSPTPPTPAPEPETEKKPEGGSRKGLLLGGAVACGLAAAGLLFYAVKGGR